MNVKRLVFSAVGVAAIAALPAAAAYASPPFSHATGDVTLYGQGDNQELNFSAFSYPDGSSTGTVTYNNYSADLAYTAAVISAVVDDTTSTSCFTYIIPPGNFVSGIEVTWKVYDGGTPGTDGDMANYSFGEPGSYSVPTTTAECTAFVPSQDETVTGGNLVVH